MACSLFHISCFSGEAPVAHFVQGNRAFELELSLCLLNDRSDGGVLRYHDAVNSVKRQLILRAIEQAGGNFTEAAKLLDLHPNYLHRLVRNMDLRKDLEP